MSVEMTAWPAAREVRPIICVYFLIVLSHLTALTAFRVRSVGTYKNLLRISFARQLIIFTLVDSWLFAFASATLLFGVGSSYDTAACDVGIWLCILLYASSKVAIYLFLMERLYVVHANVSSRTGKFSDRFRCRWYMVAFVLLTLWIGVVAVMVVGRNNTLQPDGRCMIGIKLYATVPVIVTDFAVNCFLTVGFVLPVWRAGFRNAQTLGKDSTLAAILALATSITNMAVLASEHGHQGSYICLSSCLADVTVNTTILFIITRHGSKSSGGCSTTIHARTDNNAHTTKGRHATQLRSQNVTGSAFEGIQISRTYQQAIDSPTATTVLPTISFPDAARLESQLTTPMDSQATTPAAVEKLELRFADEKEDV